MRRVQQCCLSLAIVRVSNYLIHRSTLYRSSVIAYYLLSLSNWAPIAYAMQV